MTPHPKPEPRVKNPKRRINPVSRTGRQKRADWQKVGDLLDAQGRVHCEARVSPECNGFRQHKHHILPRSRGGADVIENALPCCNSCHNHIHANPAEATRLGLLKGTNQ